MAVQKPGKVSKEKAERARAQANEVAEQRGWTDEDFHRMAHTHRRTP